MVDTLILFSFFIGAGIAWRKFEPMDITADTLQSVLISLLYNFFLPLLVLSTMWQATLNTNSWRILLVMLVTSAAAIAIAWFYYKSRGRRLSGGDKGAYILAAAFGSILIIGMPITQDWVAPWTKRTAVFYEALILMPLLFTVGIMLAKQFAGVSRNAGIGTEVVREPIIIAAVLGLILNLANVNQPGFISSWLNLSIKAIMPIGLMAVGVSLYWKSSWSRLLPDLLPVAIIQLIITPLLLWAMFHLFSVSGGQTFRSMILQAAMPSMLLGFVICQRYRLDTTAYTAAFSFTVFISLVTIPVWWILIQKGLVTQ